MSCFADSYALIAWINGRDAAHARVTGYLATFQGRLVTTEWVLMEVADALSISTHRVAVADFLRSIRTDSRFDVIGYEQSLYESGFALFTTRQDKDWSLTDCISFAAMNARGLRDALTGDRHFTQAGFVAVFGADVQ